MRVIGVKLGRDGSRQFVGFLRHGRLTVLLRWGLELGYLDHKLKGRSAGRVTTGDESCF